MVGLPTALVVRIVGASQTGGGHGIDIAKLYTFRTLALWAGPPLLLLALWERTRGQMTTGSAAG
jgi:hypothetical protein